MNEIETIAKGKHINLVRRGMWEFAQRPNISGIVGVFAVTDAGELLLVEQYRPAVNANVLELPAGLAGDLDYARGETLADAARRELLEETGYTATEMVELAQGAVAAGICDEIITLFAARGLKRESHGGGDGSENITLHVVPVKGIDRWLAEQQKAGKLIDLKIFSGLRFL